MKRWRGGSGRRRLWWRRRRREERGGVVEREREGRGGTSGELSLTGIAGAAAMASSLKKTTDSE